MAKREAPPITKKKHNRSPKQSTTTYKGDTRAHIATLVSIETRSPEYRSVQKHFPYTARERISRAPKEAVLFRE